MVTSQRFEINNDLLVGKSILVIIGLVKGKCKRRASRLDVGDR